MTFYESPRYLLDPKKFYGGGWVVVYTNYRVNLQVQTLRLDNDLGFLQTLQSSGVDLDPQLDNK